MSELTRFPNQSISTSAVNKVNHTLEKTSPHGQSISMIIAGNDNMLEKTRSSTKLIVNKENNMPGKIPCSEQSNTTSAVNERFTDKTDYANRKSTKCQNSCIENKMVHGHKKLKQRHNSRIDFNHLPLIEIPSAKTADNFKHRRSGVH